MIIIVAGFRGSGKSEFGAIAKEMGFPVFEMSGPVLALIEELGLRATNESVRTFATDFRERGGSDAVAKLLLPRIKLALQQSRTVVVIGARSEEETALFRGAGQVLTVAILSEEKKRFGRIRAREKESDPKTMRDFRWADKVEAKWGLKALLESCEVKIANNNSGEKFREKVRTLLEKYR